MAETMKIHFRSGNVQPITLDANKESPDDAAKMFHDAIDFGNTTTLRLNNLVIFIREVEAFEFC